MFSVGASTVCARLPSSVPNSFSSSLCSRAIKRNRLLLPQLLRLLGSGIPILLRSCTPSRGCRSGMVDCRRRLGSSTQPVALIEDRCADSACSHGSCDARPQSRDSCLRRDVHEDSTDSAALSPLTTRSDGCNILPILLDPMSPVV